MKLTEINGSKEALPQKKEYLINKLGYPQNILKAHNDVVADLEIISIEVDVEKLAEKLFLLDKEMYPISYVEMEQNNSIKVEYLRRSKYLASTMKQWVRLERK